MGNNKLKQLGRRDLLSNTIMLLLRSASQKSKEENTETEWKDLLEKCKHNTISCSRAFLTIKRVNGKARVKLNKEKKAQNDEESYKEKCRHEKIGCWAVILLQKQSSESKKRKEKRKEIKKKSN